MAAKRVCSDCPALIERTRRRCESCAREFERRRGTKAERGYDAAYQRARREAKREVDAGRAKCWRCGGRIEAGGTFDLGHSDDRTAIRGPEHPWCNRSAAGRSAHN
ncbi:hypothetical protein GCM10010401_07270 [Rarobacter faecitabidus]